MQFTQYSEGMFDTYKVQLRDNAYVITRDGDELSLPELKQVIKGLQENLEKRQQGISQVEIIENGMLQKLEATMPDSDFWITGKNANRYTWKPQQGYVRNGNFECVYFATHHTMPNLVKIGFTTKLRQRTKGLFNTLGRNDPVKILAYVVSNNAQDLERLIHFYMNPYRVNGEWFQKSVVMKWVKAQS